MEKREKRKVVKITMGEKVIMMLRMAAINEQVEADRISFKLATFFHRDKYPRISYEPITRRLIVYSYLPQQKNNILCKC